MKHRAMLYLLTVALMGLLIWNEWQHHATVADGHMIQLLLALAGVLAICLIVEGDARKPKRSKRWTRKDGFVDETAGHTGRRAE